jgi:hypothetical protein
MKLTRLERTCIACPSQWEGETEGGREEVYVRYRHGSLSVEVGDPEIGWMHRYPGSRPGYHAVLSIDHGDGLDGTMLTDEMLGLTGLLYGGDPVRVDVEGGADFFYLSPEEQAERLRRNLRSLGIRQGDDDGGETEPS